MAQYQPLCSHDGYGSHITDSRNRFVSEYQLLEHLPKVFDADHRRDHVQSCSHVSRSLDYFLEPRVCSHA